MEDYEFEDTEGIKRRCFCTQECPDGGAFGSCTTKPGGHCFLSVKLDEERKNQTFHLRYGCLPPGDMSRLQCETRTILEEHANETIMCCDSYDYCNKNLVAMVDSESIAYARQFIETAWTASATTTLAVIVLGIFGYVLTTWIKRRRSLSKKELAGDVVPASTQQISEDDFLNQLELDVVGRSFLDGVTMDHIVAEGTFSKIYKGTWQGQNVAIKICDRMKLSDWQREVEIYNNVSMKHSNILGYITEDVKDNKFYIISNYHSSGSLRDYLKTRNRVNVADSLQMINGLINGLIYLHLEVSGKNGLSSIIHNNINSSNILVISPTDCCFCDFSRAINFRPTDNRIDSPQNFLNDDIRYLPPEFLNGIVTTSGDYSLLLMGDVYSFSLVMWEILNSCFETYALPFDAELEAENMPLDLSSMLEIVVNAKKRPQFSSKWDDEEYFTTVIKTIKECWTEKPTGRLSTLRIKKTLFKLV